MNIIKKKIMIYYFYIHISRFNLQLSRKQVIIFFILKYLLFQAPVAQLDRATDF